MYTKVDICNMALVNFGNGRITSLDEGTENARVLNLMYDSCRQTLLSEFPWNFATNYASLSNLSGVEHPVYDHVYKYPLNALKIIRVYNCGMELQDQHYIRNYAVFSSQGRNCIATNVENAYCEYIDDVSNTGIMTSSFITCLSYLLAARVAEALTGNGQKVQEMENKYQEALARAKQANAIERYNKVQYPDRFSSYRNGGGGSWHRRYETP